MSTALVGGGKLAAPTVLNGRPAGSTPTPAPTAANLDYNAIARAVMGRTPDPKQLAEMKRYAQTGTAQSNYWIVTSGLASRIDSALRRTPRITPVATTAATPVVRTPVKPVPANISPANLKPVYAASGSPTAPRVGAPAKAPAGSNKQPCTSCAARKAPSKPGGLPGVPAGTTTPATLPAVARASAAPVATAARSGGIGGFLEGILRGGGSFRIPGLSLEWGRQPTINKLAMIGAVIAVAWIIFRRKG